MPIRFLSSSSTSTTSPSNLLPPSTPARWDDISNDRPTPGSPINYIPPPTAASQRSKAAVKVLSVHPEYAVGLGLMRLELVDRCWGLSDWESRVVNVDNTSLSSEERGKLVVVQDEGNEKGGLQVWAGRGRGWYTVADEEAAAVGPIQ
jgi:hypothetical protein